MSGHCRSARPCCQTFLCPSGVRIGALVKPFAVFKTGVNPAYAWEPVIFRLGNPGACLVTV